MLLMLCRVFVLNFALVSLVASRCCVSPKTNAALTAVWFSTFSNVSFLFFVFYIFLAASSKGNFKPSFYDILYIRLIEFHYQGSIFLSPYREYYQG